MENPIFATLLKQKELLETGDLNSDSLKDTYVQRIEKYNDDLHAFLNVDPYQTTSEGKLNGICVAIKDNFAEKNKQLEGSSDILEGFKSPYDATMIKRLMDEGMISLGKVDMDEFAMGSSGENSKHTPPATNPWGTDRIPGGSSGGSAVAVASGMCSAALGTDTGGSLRQPASMCGVVGFRPSYGRNSRYGILSMASSLDCPGTITRSVKDAAYIYNITNGEDENDRTTLPGKDSIDLDKLNNTDLSGKKIGIPKEYFEEGLDPEVKKQIENAVELMKQNGAEVVEISLPMTKYAIAAYYIIVPAEVSSNLARYDGIRYGKHQADNPESLEDIYIQNRTKGLGTEPKLRSILGSYVLSAGFYDAYYKKASQVRTKLIEDFDKAFSQVDAIACPVAPNVAWKIGEESDDPMKMYLEDAYTVPSALAGLPGISVPCGFATSNDDEAEKLPVGLQIITKYGDEKSLFEIASAYENMRGDQEMFIPESFKS